MRIQRIKQLAISYMFQHDQVSVKVRPGAEKGSAIIPCVDHFPICSRINLRSGGVVVIHTVVGHPGSEIRAPVPIDLIQVIAVRREKWGL